VVFGKRNIGQLEQRPATPLHLMFLRYAARFSHAAPVAFSDDLTIDNIVLVHIVKAPMSVHGLYAQGAIVMCPCSL
jgi:hypothetical protein